MEARDCVDEVKAIFVRLKIDSQCLIAVRPFDSFDSDTHESRVPGHESSNIIYIVNTYYCTKYNTILNAPSIAELGARVGSVGDNLACTRAPLGP